VSERIQENRVLKSLKLWKQMRLCLLGEEEREVVCLGEGLKVNVKGRWKEGGARDKRTSCGQARTSQ
jgi:hypothetical protein